MPHGFAILKPGATVHLTATDMVPAAVLPSGDTGITVAAIGREGEHVVLETLVDTAPHCAASVHAVSGLRLRWLAAPADLVPLTSRRIVVDYSDGTRSELLAGVPLRKAGDGWIAITDGVEIFVRVPDDAIAHYYVLGDRSFPEAERAPLAKGDEPLVYDRTRTLAEDRLESTSLVGRRVATFARTEKGGHTIGEVRTHCAAMRVTVPSSRAAAEAQAAPEAAGIARFFAGTAAPWTSTLTAIVSTGESTPTWFVDAGVTVYWRDGSVGGFVDRKFTFDTKPRTIGARTCFEVNLDEGAASRIDLCFDAASVQETVGASPGALDRPAESDLFGVSGLGGELGGGGLIGGTIGGGTGSGYGYAKVPRVSPAKPSVTGALDKDIIRRIVRAHINEVRFCYNKGLTKDPTLAGKVSIVFTIDGSGDVSTSKVRDDTVSDASVGVCMAKAVKRWKFPNPTGGGAVVVEYPFVLAPS